LEDLRAEIAAHGPVPFSRFMERCLYAPGLGYYSAGRTKFGAAGDFVTAPELGVLFAQSIVDAVLPSLREFGPDADFCELGGGSGAFAEAALQAFAAADVVPCRYRILEPSADLRERQRTVLTQSRLLAVFGVWQREGEAKNLIAGHLQDLTPLLHGLSTASRDFH